MVKVHHISLFLAHEDYEYAKKIKKRVNMSWDELFITALKMAFDKPEEPETEEESKRPARKCPGCGREIPEDAKICPYCGISLESGGFSILPGL